jgi:hypothetical protein
MLGSAVNRLENLVLLDDELLGASEDPAGRFELLRGSDAFHDQATLSLSESLDGWLTMGYLNQDHTVFLAREYRNSVVDGPVLVSVLSSADYEPLVDALRHYWESNGGNTPTNPARS